MKQKSRRKSQLYYTQKSLKRKEKPKKKEETPADANADESAEATIKRVVSKEDIATLMQNSESQNKLQEDEVILAKEPKSDYEPPNKVAFQEEDEYKKHIEQMSQKHSLPAVPAMPVTTMAAICAAPVHSFRDQTEACNYTYESDQHLNSKRFNARKEHISNDCSR